MKTYLDCIPCFFRQALEGARIAGLGKKKQKRLMDAMARRLPKISLRQSPPEAARLVNRLMRDITGDSDIYRRAKKKSNLLALSAYGRLVNKVFYSRDSLLAAVELAIAGNIIDYGAKHSLNVEEELAKILQDENRIIKKENKVLFNYISFRDALLKAKQILYLADNAGEVVFDRILIEEIRRRYPGKKIFFAVKAKPAINDALAEDAIACGINEIAEIISTGVDTPGTVLPLCSRDFLKIYRQADMIISKGQGNFEALSLSRRPIFFMFTAKCPVVAGEVGCKIGDIILLDGKTKRRK